MQPVTTGELEGVGGVMPGARDLGLAYAQMADRGDQAAGMRAQQLLRQAEKEEQGAAADEEVHAQLGFLEQVSGHPDQAAAEYRMALTANPYDSLALGDLGLIEAQQHHLGEAVRLWRTVVEHDPAQVGAGMNLAIVECETGDRASSLATLERLWSFPPMTARPGLWRERFAPATVLARPGDPGPRLLFQGPVDTIKKESPVYY